ncbi:MAG: hypothetical protein QMD61_00985 [Methanobacterium sp.]|nr:hypothetical protein [Methanobacterium sp.]
MSYRGAFGHYNKGKINLDSSNENFEPLQDGEEVIIFSSSQFKEWVERLQEQIIDIENFDRDTLNFLMRY